MNEQDRLIIRTVMAELDYDLEQIFKADAVTTPGFFSVTDQISILLSVQQVRYLNWITRSIVDDNK